MYNNYRSYRNENRIGFLGPFLLGGLVGGTAVGVSRPRPVYVNPGPPMGGFPQYGNVPPYYGPRPPYYY